jgi:hypothetical protein
MAVVAARSNITVAFFNDLNVCPRLDLDLVGDRLFKPWYA